MRKSLQFRPVISGAELEERVVLSVSASLVPAAISTAPAQTPVVTQAGVTRTLNDLHSALVSYQGVATNAILYAEAQIAAGHVTAAAASNLLVSYLSNKTSLLFTETRAATADLPFGAGYNGYVNSTFTAVSATPSGSDSLYQTLTFPSNGTNGPIVALELNLYQFVRTSNFSGALTAVNSAAIRATYAAVKADVTGYVVNGVRHHDFIFRG